jgi:heme exporter protein C
VGWMRRFEWLDLLGILTGLSLIAGLYFALVYAPTERLQGPVQRIFYFHVPSAWVSYLAFFVVFVASILYLWRRSVFWDRLGRASAEVGLVFTTLTIVTGSIWARPIWGTWWTWDARLTTTLILWFIYLAYLAVRSYVADPNRAARFAAILGIIGFIDVPVIHMSVVWWRTLHPEPVVVRAEGPALEPPMLVALLVGLAAMTLFYVYLLVHRVMVEETRDDLQLIRQRLAE